MGCLDCHEANIAWDINATLNEGAVRPCVANEHLKNQSTSGPEDVHSHDRVGTKLRLVSVQVEAGRSRLFRLPI
jgi:hypothetical protein